MFARLILAPLLLALGTLAHGAQVVDYITAVVNDDVILHSELQQTVDQLRRQLAERGQLPPDDVLERQVLERMIVTRIQVQRAQQGGLSVSDQELNQAMAEIAARNNLDLNQFARALRREGIDYLHLRRQVRDDMLVNRLRQREVDARIAVSDDDVALALEKQGQDDQTEYRLAHILIPISADASETAQGEAKALAGRIVEQARAGEDFAELAIAHSASPRALEGGDLGWRRGNELPTLFASRVPRMEAGEVSDPIPAGAALHIVKLVDKRGALAGQAMVQETRARHILLKPNVLRDRAQTRARLEELRSKIRAGADFGTLAKQHSEDPGSANQGGDLGWQGPQSFVPEFQRALGVLDKGEISPVFESPFGFHIVELLDRRDRDRSEELRRAQARESVFKRKANEEFELWVRQLRDEAYVEYRDTPEPG